MKVGSRNRYIGAQSVSIYLFVKSTFLYFFTFIHFVIADVCVFHQFCTFFIYSSKQNVDSVAQKMNEL